MRPKIIRAGTFTAIPSQVQRLYERRVAKSKEVMCCGLPIIVLRGVYQTSADTELLAESVRIAPSENFLEVGCGTGVVSIVLAKQGNRGIGVDINKSAIKNSRMNAARHKVRNVAFLESDVFKGVREAFDVVVCNPPYSDHPASDTIDTMFWDKGNEMKRRFFKEAGTLLKPNGRIYFGWADFADIDVMLPFKLAKENGFRVMNTFEKPSSQKNYKFYVLEFQRKNPI